MDSQLNLNAVFGDLLSRLAEIENLNDTSKIYDKQIAYERVLKPIKAYIFHFSVVKGKDKVERAIQIILNLQSRVDAIVHSMLSADPFYEVFTNKQLDDEVDNRSRFIVEELKYYHEELLKLQNSFHQIDITEKPVQKTVNFRIKKSEENVRLLKSIYNFYTTSRSFINTEKTDEETFIDFFTSNNVLEFSRTSKQKIYIDCQIDQAAVILSEIKILFGNKVTYSAIEKSEMFIKNEDGQPIKAGDISSPRSKHVKGVRIIKEKKKIQKFFADLKKSG